MVQEIPRISGKLPGRFARAVLDKDDHYISKSYTRNYPLVVKRGKGASLEDEDGNIFLDFTSGIAVCNTGHCHPEVVEAIKNQAEKLIHMSGTDFYYRPQADLAEKLAHITPGTPDKRVFFCNSGAESIEAALKLARYHSKRQRIIAFLGAFHGRTMGALSLTASKAVQEKGFAPLVPGVSHVPYGYCYRCPYNLTPDSCDTYCVKWIEEDLFRRVIPPEEVAAIFVEPIQGEGGYIIPPVDFHRKLRDLCDKYGILYVADEVQTGMGRTGKMFALEHFGIEPDIMTLAKGIASGMPLGAMISKSTVMNWVPGSHASTFGGNPVSCAAALKTIELLEGGLIENARVVGTYLTSRLKEMQKRFEMIGDVRGMGLMVGVELVRDREKKTKAIEERDILIQRCFKRGLLLLGCGENTVRLIPPLVITRDEIDRGLMIFEESLGNIEKENRR